MSHPQTPTEFVFGMQSVKETLLTEKEIERDYIHKAIKSDVIREVLA